jgi:hypothetical protein
MQASFKSSVYSNSCEMCLALGAHMFPLEADFRVCSRGHRVNTIALPFVGVQLIPVPESATEVDAWNTPTGRLDSSDGLQHLFEMGSIPIELEGQHDVPIERSIQALADDTT